MADLLRSSGCTFSASSGCSSSRSKARIEASSCLPGREASSSVLPSAIFHSSIFSWPERNRVIVLPQPLGRACNAAGGWISAARDSTLQLRE